MGAGDGLGGCYACIKYLMFAFNFIFWLVGCALVGVGIWILVDEGFKDVIADSEFEYLQYGGVTLIVVGGIVMVVGFFGCCGAIRESQCLLVMFFICMLLLFLALVAAGVLCIMFKDPLTDSAVEAFSKGVDDYTVDDPVEFVDLLQAGFGCCGVTNSDDYKDTIGDPPSSCLVENYAKGCREVVTSTLEQYFAIAAGVTLGTGAVMLIGMIFSMMLCCAIRDEDR